MIPEVAAMQAIAKIGFNRDEITEKVWDQIVQETAEMIKTGLDLDPNTGNEQDLKELDKNTRYILGRSCNSK